MSMIKYVALLRGINVGGNCKVEMARLKKAFEKLGFENVKTYINSGNVIFESAEKDPRKMNDKIEKHLEKTFGFSIKTVLRDASNILMLTKKIPKEWKNGGDQKTDILFLWEDYDSKESLKLIEPKEGVDQLMYLPGAIVWNVDRRQISKTGMKRFIGSKLYKNMTARNVNTLRKLAEMLTGS